MGLEDFVKSMDELKELQLASETLQQEDDSVKIDNARKYLESAAIRTIEENTGVKVDPSKLTPDDINNALEDRKNRLMYDSVGTSLHDKGLEEVMNSIEPKALETLALSKEIGKGNVKGYEELLKRYEGYRQAMELGRKYAAGTASPQELKFFYEGAADAFAKQVLERNKNKGYSAVTLEGIARTARLLVINGGVDQKEALDAGVNSYVEGAKKEFEEYQENSGKKVINYVKESIRALRDNERPEDSSLARQILYQAAKKK